MTAPTLQSVLAPAMHELLKLRQALGYQDKTYVTHLASFDRFVSGRGQMDPWLTRDSVEAWVSSNPQLKARARAHRFSALRVLARFIADQYPQTYVPGPTPGLTSTFRPTSTRPRKSRHS